MRDWMQVDDTGKLNFLMISKILSVTRYKFFHDDYARIHKPFGDLTESFCIRFRCGIKTWRINKHDALTILMCCLDSSDIGGSSSHTVSNCVVSLTTGSRDKLFLVEQVR